MGVKGLRAAESALGPRAFGEFPWLKVPIYNLVYDLLHDPARDPVRDPAEGGCDCVVVAVWRWPCSGDRVAVI